MATSARITPLGINKTKPKAKDYWLSDDDGTRGGGRLVVRISPSNSKLFYFRYSINGERRLLPIGPFSLDTLNGYFTLEQAREDFRRYSALHRKPESKDVIAYLEQIDTEKATAKRQIEEKLRADQIELERESKYSLIKLCDTYAAHLKKLEKPSSGDVSSLFKLYVKESDIAMLPAKSITAKQVTALLRKIVDDGKGRTAGKLRSSMRAAYELAVKAELDPSTPSAFLDFGIESNPVAATAALSKFSNASDRSLSNVEMGELWRRLKAVPDDGPIKLLALRLIILLGGQRAEQLVKVTISKGVDLEENIVTLQDPKGRRTKPRLHSIPIVGLAIDDVRNLIKRSALLESDWLIANRKSYLKANTLSNAILDISKDMIAKEITASRFRFGDLRRTAETMMASLNVLEKTRAQLQSHGLSGVQQRHYDRYDYLDEKHDALEKWHLHLESLASGKPVQRNNVRNLKRA